MTNIDIIGILDSVLKRNPRAYRVVEVLVGRFVAPATRILQRFLDGPRDGETLMRAEEEMAGAAAALGGQLIAGAVAVLLQDAEWLRAAAAESQARVSEFLLVAAGPRETVVNLLGGVRVRLVVPYYRSRRRNRVGHRRGTGKRRRSGEGECVYPALAALGIRARFSPGLESEVARQSSRGASFEEAQKALAERGCELDPKSVRRVALRVGKAALEQRDARVEAAADGDIFSEEFAGKRVVLGLDGGRLRTREGGKRGRQNKKGRRRFKTPWREPKLITAYTIDSEGKQQGDVTPLYDATLGDADAAFQILVSELKLHGAAKAAQVILAGDGALFMAPIALFALWEIVQVPEKRRLPRLALHLGLYSVAGALLMVFGGPIFAIFYQGGDSAPLDVAVALPLGAAAGLVIGLIEYSGKKA